MEQEIFIEKVSLYEQIAFNIQRLIEQEVLKAGDKMPSVRMLSAEQKVSMSTVFQAYYLLEKKGMIEARPRSGYYVKKSPKRNAEPSATSTWKLPINVRVDSLVSDFIKPFEKDSIVDLSIAGPSVDLLPVAKLNKSIQAVLRQNKGNSFQYSFPPGDENLLRQIARLSMHWGGSLSSNEIIVTNGCMEAINICLRAVAKQGDTIAIESPTYYGVLQTIESLGMKVLEIATYPDKGIDVDELEKALDKTEVAACLFTLNFNNPLGSCMPDAEKKRLVDLLAEREIPLIEDDILGDIYFGKSRPKTAKTFDKKGLVLLCSSFSKTIAPGLRVGWTAPGLYKEKVERLKFMTSISAPTLMQQAVAHFLENGRYDNHLKTLRLSYHIQMRKYREAIFRYFPEGTKVTDPQGGHVMWIELPSEIDTTILQGKALAHGIAILPGSIFSAQKRHQHFIRIGYCNQFTPEIENALGVLGRLVGEMQTECN
ncbi:PLP-dependent aminotransferase family protein [Solitalea lacus]|uniref:aminotransferase-like domain-containing protein n=1 Tax=Solitalea lacus TaxID=2911172 RepID=UPI001EDA4860|nr:PLP-dependent aminotransferase family protein [Solitalea lacus]UKJ06606.1 PLP-dependent aminotransferase family protein [Solitalea lacus]